MARQATLGTLAQGDYTFRSSRSAPRGAKGEEATYPFTLDTTPPAPPVIDARPINGSRDIAPAGSRGRRGARHLRVGA